MREFGHFLLKWWGVFLVVGLILMFYGLFNINGTDNGGVFGDVLRVIGQFFVLSFTEVVFPILRFIGRTISGLLP